jgi:hypothetical protein
MSPTTCESCSMPIEDGRYCPHCTDDAGNLQAFDERLTRMVQWSTRHGDPDRSAAQVLRETLEFMQTMPAWRDHPELIARRAQSDVTSG